MGLAVLSTSPPRISRNEACTVVSVMPYMLISRGKPGWASSHVAEALGFECLTAEHHRLKLQLSAQLGPQRIGGSATHKTPTGSGSAQ